MLQVEEKEMIIDTKYSGECEVDEKEIIYFESGLPGFLEEKKFVILSIDQDSPIYILQSTTTPYLAFFITTPFVIDQHYDITIPDPVVKSLKLNNKDEVVLYVVLTLHDPFKESTANLKAPLIVNRVSRLGKQLVLNDSNYQIKHPLGQVSTVGQED